MNPSHIASLTLALAMIAPVASHANLSVYSQNFEGLNALDPDALNGNGWQIYAGVYSPDGSTFLYGYGAFPAPNGDLAFSRIGSGYGGPGQGLQQLVVYNDYNNSSAHLSGQRVQANVFQVQPIGATDAGSTWRFEFDARFGELAPPGTALAFVLTLDPANNYAVTGMTTLDMSALPGAWGHYSITLPITVAAGQLLEFGFANTTTHYQPSAVFYDNVTFAPVPEPSAGALMLAGLGLAGLAARRRGSKT